MTLAPRRRGPIPLTRADLMTYATEIVTAVREGDDEAEDVLDHLKGLLTVSHPAYKGHDTPIKAMRYFVAGYTWWGKKRDNSDEEVTALDLLGDADAKALAAPRTAGAPRSLHLPAGHRGEAAGAGGGAQDPDNI